MIVRILCTVAVLSVAGCYAGKAGDSDVGDPANVDAGWHYSWNGGAPRTAFGFGNPSTSYFVGVCDAQPIFGLVDNSYSRRTKVVSLIANNVKRDFAIFKGVHGGALLFTATQSASSGHKASGSQFNLATARDLAQSSHSIVVRTDDGWERQIPPSSNLRRFLRECMEYRRKNGAAER